MDSENGFVTKKHVANSEGTNDGIVILPELKISMSSSSSSSESSIDSSYVGKDESNLESKEVSAPEVSGHNPSSSAMNPQKLISMQSSGGYDPNRIPSSIFASKPSTPMEWSVASNESLFSIHMGNNSFSKDNAFMLYKSGELPNLEDTNNLPPSQLPIIVAQTFEKKIEDMNEDSKVTEEKLVESAKVEPEFPANSTKAVPEETQKNISQEKATSADDLRNSSSSTQSFQFPVLEANAAGSGSVKVAIGKSPSKKQPKQESQPQTPGTPPKPNGRSWFSCFSCCSVGS
ncbi:hypothetical protein P3X46_016358 [Hevea brasiliensis]|uniref:Uncharacterized protein n=1 Tax=Hevea brasiliensis TaxID=3981 RepID=A0ABQ9M179_HEVBR|nr:uncharacterized protein LOC110641126 [Hevea brasiliensis]KAJ9173195.1 hypothetical protein P3X46_016358 [Hevea brasiliensis]